MTSPEASGKRRSQSEAAVASVDEPREPRSAQRGAGCARPPPAKPPRPLAERSAVASAIPLCRLNSLARPGLCGEIRKRAQPAFHVASCLRANSPRRFCSARVRCWPKASVRSVAALCPKSGCAFNRSVQHRLQSIGWRLEAQGLSRTLIEPQSNRVQITLRDAREIGSSREVLPQQAVGVLV